MTSAVAEAAFEQATYDVILKLTLTRITECPPSRRSVDTLRKEVEYAMIKIMCPHWDWAGRFGLLAEIKPAAKYARITGGLVYSPVSDDLPDLLSAWIRRGNSKPSKRERRQSGVHTASRGSPEGGALVQSASIFAIPSHQQTTIYAEPI